MNDSNHPTVQICLALVVVSYFASAILTQFIAPVFPKFDIILGELLFILPTFLYLRHTKYDFRAALRLNKIDKKLTVASILLGLSITVLIDELDRIISTFLTMPPELEEVILKTLKIESFVDGVILFIAVVVFAAVFEEMAFRGLLQQAFEHKLNLQNALFVTALVFAFLHVFPPWIIQVLILGLLLGYFAWRTDSIFPGVVLHAINNAFALVFLNLPEQSMTWYNWNDHVNPPIIVVASGVTYYGIKWFHSYTEQDAHELASSEPKS